MAEIQIQQVTKIFGKGQQAAVNNVNLTVADGEFMVLLGPSGCGKTTLLRMIAGLEYPSMGRILIGGRGSPHSRIVEPKNVRMNTASSLTGSVETLS